MAAVIHSKLTSKIERARLTPHTFSPNSRSKNIDFVEDKSMRFFVEPINSGHAVISAAWDRKDRPLIVRSVHTRRNARNSTKRTRKIIIASIIDDTRASLFYPSLSISIILISLIIIVVFDAKYMRKKKVNNDKAGVPRDEGKVRK